MNFDSFAYIPHLATAFIALALCVLLVIIKVRNTAHVSYVMFVSLFLLLAGVIYTLMHPLENPVMAMAVTVFSISVILLPYCILLCGFAPKQKEEEKPEQEEPQAAQQVTVIQPEPKELSLLETGKSYITRAVSALGSGGGMQSLLEHIGTSVKEASSADGSLVLLVDEFDDAITVKSYEGVFPPPYKLPDDMPHKPIRIDTNLKHAQFELHGNIFGEVAINGQAELINDPLTDPRIVENGPEDFLKLGSYIFLPMKVGDTVFGVVALARKPQNGKFTGEEFSNSQLLMDFASTAVKTVFSFQEKVERSVLENEGKIATRIQKTLQPERLPVIAGTALGSFHNSADGICGDYYDVIPARKDRVAFIMSDIAGKGTNSLVVMVAIRAMLHLITNTTQSAGTILTWANKGLTSDTNKDHFGSIALLLYNPLRHTVQISSCGVIPVLLYSKEKQSVERISVSSDPIGVGKSTVYKDIEVSVKPGDILLTYTDGLVEAQNEKGAQYSYDNLVSVLKENNQLSGRDIANKVRQDIKTFSGAAHQHDDQTLLAIKIQ